MLVGRKHVSLAMAKEDDVAAWLQSHCHPNRIRTGMPMRMRAIASVGGMMLRMRRKARGSNEKQQRRNRSHGKSVHPIAICWDAERIGTNVSRAGWPLQRQDYRGWTSTSRACDG
jgi:hypothetical protein